MTHNLINQTIEQADALFTEGEKLYNQNKYNEYCNLFEKASNIYLVHENWEKYICCRHRMAMWHLKRQHIEAAKEISENLLEIYQQRIGGETVLQGDLYFLSFSVLISERKYKEASILIEKALSIYTNQNHFSGLVDVIIGKGDIQLITYQFQQALGTFFKALKMQKKQSEDKLGEIYYQIGYTYHQLRQYQLSKAYFQKAQSSFIHTYGIHYPLVAKVKSMLGENLIRFRQLKKALISLQEAKALFAKHTFKDKYTAINIMHIGKVYGLLEEWEKAESYFQLAIDLQLKHEPINHIWFLDTFTIMGDVYFFGGKYKQAQEKFTEALKWNENSYISYFQKNAVIYLRLAITFYKLRKPFEALSHIEQANENWEKAFSDIQQKNNWQYISIKFRELTINYELYNHTSSIEYLEKALQLIENLHQQFEQLKAGIFEEQDRLSFSQRATDFYQTSIDVLFEQYLLEGNTDLLKQLFLFSEKNKVYSLLFNIKNTDALHLSSIPEVQLEEFQKLQTQINAIQTKLNQMESDSDVDDLDGYASKLTDFQIRYHHLIQAVEQANPEYFTLKHQMSFSTLSDLRLQLPNHTAAIAYTLTRQFVYIFCIHAQKVSLQRISLTNDFHTQMDIFIGEGILGMNRKSYVQYGHQFYQLLIAPIEASLQAYHIQSLLILPDSQLLELPFEILLNHPTSFRAAYKNMPFLLKQYNVYYHYSATLRQYQNQRNRSFKKLPTRLLGFAPVYDQEHFSLDESEQLQEEAIRDVSIQGKNYKALLYSEEEIKDIQANFQKKGWEVATFLHEEANLSRFKEKINQLPAKYVHIAAHGVSNKQKNVLGILFSPETHASNSISPKSNPQTTPFNVRQQSESSNSSSILYAHEVYQLNLQSDLVFLSCCESGVGKIAKGEGILSINRGLLYSGVANIVFTLFKIYDQKTANFVHHFYDYLLHKEDNYAAALRYAKLQMIRENLPPKYWSGFLLLGN